MQLFIYSPLAKRRDLARLSLIFCLLAASSCRVRFPSYAEQQYLLGHDAFPSGPPPWMAAPLAASKGGGGGVMATSLIPQVYGESIGEIESVAYASSASGLRLVRGDISERELAAAGNPDSEKEGEQASPLNRILALCPTVEADVTEALQTIEITMRIRKYEALTKRCSASEDLWLWLARDYKKAGRLVEAGRSFEQVLILDNTNQEASTALASIRQQLERGKAGNP